MTRTSPAFVDRAPRVALIVYLVISVVSFILAIRWGTERSFFFDDWDFLAARDAGSFDSLMRPHNEHWTTIPILAYRAVWTIFGLQSYTPYLLLSISTHLAAAGLLRAVMRSSDVAPWIATAAAGLFALFGTGAMNILFAFQITYVGALAFGLLQLWLADHGGPIGWRDGLAVAAGLASLMCCNHGVAMVFIVGLAVLLKRGWSPALLQTAPLALVFLTWWFVYGQLGVEGFHSTPREIVLFVASGVIGTFNAVGQLPGVGLVWAIIILPGFVFMWQSSRWSGLRTYFGTPVALALGSLVFFAITGYGRAFWGAESARESRYMDMGAAMWLPLIAVAATVLARRWWVAGVVAIALFLIGITGNTKLLSEYQQKSANNRAFLNQLLALAHSDLLASAPVDVRPFPEMAREVSTGWLAEGVRSGRLPKPETVGTESYENLKFRLSFRQGTQKVTDESCELVTTPIELNLDAGDRLIITGIALTIGDQNAPNTRTLSYFTNFTQRLGNQIDLLAPEQVRLTAGPNPQIQVCR